MIGGNNPRNSILRTSNKPLFESAFDRRWTSRYQSPVLFVDRVVSELLAEPRRTLASSRKRDRTGDRCVEATDHTKVDASGLVVFTLDVQPCRLQQASLVRRRSLDDPVCGFVHDQQMVVFVEDLGRMHARGVL